MSGDLVDLDARLAFVLALGWSLPEEPATREQYRILEARVREVRTLADSEGSIATTHEEIAAGLAELAGLRTPTRPETVELLATLVLDIQASGILGAREAFLIGGLMDFGWPLHTEERLVDNVIAAADLGMFDPPGSVDLNELEPPRSSATVDEETGAMTFRWSSEPDSAFVSARQGRSAQPTPSDPRTVNEQFLFDWEFLLGAIVDTLMQELNSRDYVRVGPG